MAVIIAEEMIKEIADQLDSGMICFYHIPTGELESHPDEMKGWGGFDEEPWEETIEKVENNYHEYVRFEGLESHESFRIMENFVMEVSDKKIRQRLIDAISYKKPFQNFKFILNQYPELRQQWFEYKKAYYIEYVIEQLTDYNVSKDRE